MALNIDNATFGYDSNGVIAALKNINIQVIEASCTKMDAGSNELKSWVDAAWVGKSAEQFKKNMDTDRKTIEDCLRETNNAINSVIKNQIGGVIAEADQNLVKARGE